MGAWPPVVLFVAALASAVLQCAEATRGASDENDEEQTKVVLTIDGGHFIKNTGDGNGHKRHKAHHYQAAPPDTAPPAAVGASLLNGTPLVAAVAAAPPAAASSLSETIGVVTEESDAVAQAYAALAEKEAKVAAAEAAVASAAAAAAKAVASARYQPHGAGEPPHEYTLFFAVMAFPLLLCVAGVVSGFLPRRGGDPHIDSKEGECKQPATLGEQVDALDVCSWARVEELLGAIDSYDCSLPRPKSSRQVLRIEARIEGMAPAGSSPLIAPLARQECVLYSTVVARQLHDGEAQVPVAFASESADFVVAPLDQPDKRIWINGEDVLLFDLLEGRFNEEGTLAASPLHWQEFVQTHRASSGSDWQWRGNSEKHWEETAALKFQECALLLGSTVTLVGELHRGTDGELSLRPAQSLRETPKGPKKSLGSSLTSWEGGASLTTRLAASSTNKFAHKVLVSDSVLLLHHDASPSPGEPLPCSEPSHPPRFLAQWLACAAPRR